MKIHTVIAGAQSLSLRALLAKESNREHSL